MLWHQRAPCRICPRKEVRSQGSPPAQWSGGGLEGRRMMGVSGFGPGRGRFERLLLSSHLLGAGGPSSRRFRRFCQLSSVIVFWEPLWSLLLISSLFQLGKSLGCILASIFWNFFRVCWLGKSQSCPSTWMCWRGKMPLPAGFLLCLRTFESAGGTAHGWI